MSGLFSGDALGASLATLTAVAVAAGCYWTLSKFSVVRVRGPSAPSEGDPEQTIILYGVSLWVLPLRCCSFHLPACSLSCF